LSIRELINLTKNGMFVLTEICVVIQTAFPFRELFNSLLTWTIQFDRIGRFQLTSRIDVALRSDAPIELDWPRGQAAAFQEFIDQLYDTPFNEQSAEFAFDQSPYPPIHWRNPAHDRPEQELAWQTLSTLLRHTTRAGFELLLSALLTERPMLIVGPHVSTVTDVVLAVQLMIHPLRWVGPSVSLIPHEMLDFLDLPTTWLYGLAGLSVPCPAHAVLVDLGSKTVKTSLKVLEAPDVETRERGKVEFRREFRRHWDKVASAPEDAARDIMRDIAMLVSKLLEPVTRSIVTNIGSPQAVTSTFVPELYLAHFNRDHRRFVQAFSETQMLQFVVQRICKEQSNTFRSEMTPASHV
jgi:hypothetical protein